MANGQQPEIIGHLETEKERLQSEVTQLEAQLAQVHKLLDHVEGMITGYQQVHLGLEKPLPCLVPGCPRTFRDNRERAVHLSVTPGPNHKEAWKAGAFVGEYPNSAKNKASRASRTPRRAAPATGAAQVTEGAWPCPVEGCTDSPRDSKLARNLHLSKKHPKEWRANWREWAEPNSIFYRTRQAEEAAASAVSHTSNGGRPAAQPQVVDQPSTSTMEEVLGAPSPIDLH